MDPSLPFPAFQLVERWVDESARAGERFGVADLWIAAIAHGQGGELWTVDDDFAGMAHLGFVELHVPAPASEQ